MANKYCPQFQMGGTVGEGGWGRALVNENACPWALLIEPPEGASPFEPVTQIIARAWIGGDNIERQYTLAGEQGARDYYERLRPFYDVRRYVDVWQGPNEPFVGEVTFWRALVDFTLELDRLMRGDDRTLAGGAFSVGWPLLDSKYLVDLLPMYQGCRYMIHHEYSAPRMQNREGWHCLRYRKIYKALNDMSPFPLAPLFIGETGIDGGVAPVYRAKTGWKDYCPGGFSEYLEQLRWYGSEIAKDDYVVAAFPFVAGANQEWSRFDIDEPQMQQVLSLDIAGGGRLPLPEDETATDAGTLCEKARWFLEEMARQREVGNFKRADDIHYSLIELLYRAERAAKAAGC